MAFVVEKPKNTFRIHLGLVLAEAICIPAFIFETGRALSGNLLSWAYVFEWPLLAGYAVFMWKKMLNEERGISTRPAVAPAENDPELDAWNAYLDSVHGKNQASDVDSREV